MRKPQLELADVVCGFLGVYQEQFGDRMLPSHHRALQDIVQCMIETMAEAATTVMTVMKPSGVITALVTGHAPNATVSGFQSG